MIKEFLSKNWKLIVILTVGVLVAYGSVIYMGKDNPIEQEVELLIQEETGVKIDLTP